MPNFTENAIKATFLELLEKKPLTDITVKMIVEECGINRNSFYYHYQDIPALIEEIIKDESDKLISENPTIDSVEQAMKAATSFASRNRTAIMHIYNSVNRDIFERYLWNVCGHIVETYGRSIEGWDKVSEFDRGIINRFYKCECFGVVIEWLNDRMTTDVNVYIDRFCELYHGMAEEMVKRCLTVK
jgi:AcrR family transcriptional regulator